MHEKMCCSVIFDGFARAANGVHCNSFPVSCVPNKITNKWKLTTIFTASFSFLFRLRVCSDVFRSVECFVFDDSVFVTLYNELPVFYCTPLPIISTRTFWVQ